MLKDIQSIRKNIDKDFSMIFEQAERITTKCDRKCRPETIVSSLKKCSKHMYPNLSVLLKLAAALPVTLCEGKRSFSALQRLRTWLRASMTIKRLSSLAIINIHRGVQVNYKRAVKIFLELYMKLHVKLNNTENLKTLKKNSGLDKYPQLTKNIENKERRNDCVNIPLLF